MPASAQTLVAANTTFGRPGDEPTRTAPSELPAEHTPTVVATIPTQVFTKPPSEPTARSERVRKPATRVAATDETPPPVVVYVRDPVRSRLWWAASALVCTLFGLVFVEAHVVGGVVDPQGTAFEAPRTSERVDAAVLAAPVPVTVASIPREPLELAPESSEAPATPKPLAPAYGSIDVHSTPSAAQVFLQGYRIGRTPLLGVRLPEGRHRFELRRAEASAVVDVRVRGGERIETRVALAESAPEYP